jgi:hypothetical protein
MYLRGVVVIIRGLVTCLLFGAAQAWAGPSHGSDDHLVCAHAVAPDLKDTGGAFRLRLITDGLAEAEPLEEQLGEASRRMYELWKFFVGEENLQQPIIVVQLLSAEGQFDAQFAELYPQAEPASGYYSMRDNRAYVRFDPDYHQQAASVMFHEVSHVITTRHLGPTSPWISEGLASYFENMQFQGSRGMVASNQGHLNELRQQALPSLNEMMAMDWVSWAGPEQDLHDARAWSFIYFLMENPHGRYALQDTIHWVGQNRCQDGPVAEVLGRAYPGGLEKLELDWHLWLFNGAADSPPV